MYNVASSLFWYKGLFVVELLISEGLVMYTLRKKSKFALKAVFGSLALIAFAFAIPIFAYNAAYLSFIFIVLFAASLLVLKLCFAESLYKITFCGILAYTVQHMSYLTNDYFGRMIFNFNDTVYSSVSPSSIEPLSIIVYFCVYVTIYLLVWAFVSVNIRKNSELKLRNMRLLILSSVILASDIILNSVVVYGFDAPTKILLSVLYAYALLSCLLALGIQYFMMRNDLLETETQVIKSMWREDKLHYEMKREQAELINIKCHDIKHRLREFGAQSGMSEESIKEITDTVEIYESVVATGNEALDVVLSENILFCRSKNIKLLCTVDGKQLAFIKTTDLYSVFDNAIHNAIEAVNKVADEEKRIIKINVACVNAMVVIHEENYFVNDGTLIFNGDLPRTTKADANEHGYGLRSMQLIAQKYGGHFAVTVKNDLFSLNIFIPKK